MSPKVTELASGVWRAAGSIIIMLLVIGVLVGLWFLLPDYASQPGESMACPSSVEPTEQDPLARGVLPVPLILEKPEGVTISFGRDRGVHSKTVFLQTAKKNPLGEKTEYAPLQPGTVLDVNERPLERQELDGTIGPSVYVSVADVTSRKEVRLTVCADASRSEIDAGTYVGSVRVAGRGIQPVTVPVAINLQYAGYRWIVPLLAVITFIGGSFIVWASHKRAQQEAPERSIWRDIPELPGWIANNYVGVAGGVIAAVSVFIAKYWRNPPWGANAPEDWFALLGVMFTAYTTTLTAATAIVGPRHQEQQGSSDGTRRGPTPPQ